MKKSEKLGVDTKKQLRRPTKISATTARKIVQETRAREEPKWGTV